RGRSVKGRGHLAPGAPARRVDGGHGRDDRRSRQRAGESEQKEDLPERPEAERRRDRRRLGGGFERNTPGQGTAQDGRGQREGGENQQVPNEKEAGLSQAWRAARAKADLASPCARARAGSARREASAKARPRPPKASGTWRSP